MNKFVIYLIAVIVFVLLLLIIEYNYIYLNFEEYNLNYIENDYCKKYFEDLTTIEKLSCDNKYKKSKFIWIAFDGLAYDLLYDLKNKDKYKLLNFFKVIQKGLKITGPIHETQITGKYSVNQKYKTIKKDNIFTQMNKNDQFIDYHGFNYPYELYFRKRPTFKNVYIEEDFEDYSLKNFCDFNLSLNDNEPNNYLNKLIEKPGHLKNKNDLDNIYKYFDNYISNKVNFDFNECFENLDFFINNKSFLYYSDNIDHTNHLYFKYHKNNIKNIYALEKFIKELFIWIDNNSDYALIISSDHGGAEVPIEEYFYNHGNYKENNSAIFLIYTKEFKDKYDEWVDNKNNNKKIHLSDISSTLAQILKGVNIPIQSEGIPEFLGNDEILRVSAVKSKEFQLISFIEEYEKKYNKNILNKKLNDLKNSKFKEIDNLNYFNEKNSIEYMNFLRNIQNDILKILKKNEKYSYFQIIMIFIFSIKLIFDMYIFFREKLDNNKNNKFELFFKLFIYFIVCFESFYCLICFKNENFNSINFFSKNLSLLLLGILSLIYFLIKLEKDKLIFIFLIFISLPILIIFYKYKVLSKINELLFKYYKYQYLIIALLLIYSFFLVKFITKSTKNYYFRNYINKNLYYILNLLNIFFHIIYFIFQFYNFFYYNVNLNVFFEIFKYTYYILLFCLIIISFSIFKKKENNKNYQMILLNLFKISYYFYFLIFSNTYDKLIWLFFIYPIFEIFNNKFKKSDNYFRIIIIIFYIIFSNIMFENSHYYYGFYGIGLKNKKRRYLIPLNFFIIPIYRHKYFILCSTFLLSISKISKKNFFNKRSLLINKILMIFIDSNFIFYYSKTYKIGNEHKFSIAIFSIINCNVIIFIIYNIILLIYKFIAYKSLSNYEISLETKTDINNSKYIKEDIQLKAINSEKKM